jgi:hypothetical protein
MGKLDRQGRNPEYPNFNWKRECNNCPHNQGCTTSKLQLCSHRS